jgi:hypothetical protein
MLLLLRCPAVFCIVLWIFLGSRIICSRGCFVYVHERSVLGWSLVELRCNE